MPIGFVLITTSPGSEQEVRDKLDTVELVTNRWMLFGEYDLIVRIQADDESLLARCIIEDIRTLDGVIDTRTLLGAEL
ncbi:MAG: Lrp/AsnC ligand binding domain-containing protein [Candidatus Poseidoniales archaeon]|nr:Lrp/AsnC ligand binding domain-containing protein [Candidatus Poseidoniales archaeon]